MTEDKWSCPYCQKNAKELEALRQLISEYQAKLESLPPHAVLFSKDISNDISHILKKGNE